MASWAKIVGNEKRKRLVEKYAERRRELKAILADPERADEHAEARAKLAKLPRNSSPTRVVNRCGVTGRPRAYYRKFGLSRIALRELALRGQLPGVRKASW